MKTFNKGEWCEPYVFVKLIGEGKVHASDENLNKVNDRFYPILKIFKDEIERYYEVDSKESLVNIVDFNGDVIESIESSKFIDIAEKTIEKILNESGTFEIPFLENFFYELGIEKLKEGSSKKADMIMEILDTNLQRPDVLEFSIKTDFSAKATILNASQRTNFTFLIEGVSEEEMECLNSISKEDYGQKYLKKRFGIIWENFQKGKYGIEFIDERENTFYQNLRLIDSNLPNMLAFMLLYRFSHECDDIPSLTDKLIEFNPLKLDECEKDDFYKSNIYDFIEAVSFGLMPRKKWNGKYEVDGGLLTVRTDGEVLCHHIFYDSDSLKKYLFNNTRLEGASTSKHKYSELFIDNGETFFKLNLQLRFK